MSSLSHILSDPEDEYQHPNAFYTQDPGASSSSHQQAQFNTATTLVYRGGNGKTSKNSKSSKPSKSSGSSSSTRATGSSSRSSHHHSSRSKPSSKGKQPATADGIPAADDSGDFDPSSSQYTMDPGTGYGASSEGHYYAQTQHGHGSSRGDRGQTQAGNGAMYYMEPGSGGGFDAMPGADMMHGHGVDLGGTYDAGELGQQYGAMPGMHSGVMQSQLDASGHYAPDVAGFPEPQDTSEFTPVTNRPSRAKKGKPVHFCEACVPPKTYTRAEHLRRHELKHGDPNHFCQYPGCGRSFHRADLFIRHMHRHRNGEEQPQDADDGEPESSDRRGSTQSNDSPAGSMAATGAVRSTTYFSLSDRYSGNSNNNNLDNSTSTDGNETPTSRQGHRRQSSVGRGGRRGHSRSSNTRREEGEQRRNHREDQSSQNKQPKNEHPQNEQPQRRLWGSLHDAGPGGPGSSGNMSSRRHDRRDDKTIKRNRQKGDDRGGGSTPVLDKITASSRHPMAATVSAPDSGVHGFVVSGIAREGTAAGSNHYDALHDTAAVANRPLSGAPSFAGRLRAREPLHNDHRNLHDLRYSHQGQASPYVQAQPLHTHASTYGRHSRSFTMPSPSNDPQASSRTHHQYHHSDPSPAIGWSPSHSGIDIAVTSSMPFARSNMGAVNTRMAMGTVGVDFPLHMAYSVVPGSDASLSNPNGLSSTSVFDAMPPHFLYEAPHPASSSHASASQAAPFSAPPQLMASNPPPSFASASDNTSLRHIDSDSSSGSWTASSSLPSSVGSSTKGHS